jgi:hypothetical protein
MKRTEALVVFAFVAAGFAWSWVGQIYDLRSPAGRLCVTFVGFAVSFGVMWAGLRAAARADRPVLAARAVLPYHGILLSQLAYVGYLFIPLEVLVSAILLRSGGRVPGLSRVGAFGLALVTRCVAFLVTLTLASVVRRWLPGVSPR